MKGIARVAGALITASLVLIACTSTLPDQQPDIPVRSCDCFFNIEIQVWNDQNRNSSFETGEPPLAGIEFRLRMNDAINLTTAKSNFQGYTELKYATNLCSCFDWATEIAYDLPEGFELISEQWVEADTPTGRAYQIALAQFPSETALVP